MKILKIVDKNGLNYFINPNYILYIEEVKEEKYYDYKSIYIFLKDDKKLEILLDIESFENQLVVNTYEV